MITKLKQSGNGWEFYFKKDLLKLLGYNPKNIKLLITAKNSTLYITPIQENDFNKFENNMLKNFQKSGTSFSIYLSQTLIDILELSPENDSIDVTIDNDKIMLKKAKTMVEKL